MERNSLSWLLARHDDRLLQDVGLTRADAERLRHEPDTESRSHVDSHPGLLGVVSMALFAKQAM